MEDVGPRGSCQLSLRTEELSLTSFFAMGVYAHVAANGRLDSLLAARRMTEWEPAWSPGRAGGGRGHQPWLEGDVFGSKQFEAMPGTHVVHVTPASSRPVPGQLEGHRRARPPVQRVRRILSQDAAALLARARSTMQ